MEVEMIDRATLNAEQIATALTASAVAPSGHFDPYTAIDLSADGISVCVKDNFDDSGIYIGQSIISSVPEDAKNIIRVIGDLTLGGPADIRGDVIISGNLRIKDELKVSGNIRVRGTVYMSDSASFVCSSVNAKNVKITGTATVSGEMTVLGKLEVKKGGRLIIDHTGVVTMPRSNDTLSPRLIVAAGAAIEVHGKLDVVRLASLQILNNGGIWAERFNGTVDIFYDVYTYVNGNDRSDGDLAQHGKDVTIQICQNGKITSADVKINGIALNADKYKFNDRSVTISASAIDGATGDIDIHVTSDGDTIKAPKTFVTHSQDTKEMMVTASSLLSMLISAYVNSSRKRC